MVSTIRFVCLDKDKVLAGRFRKDVTFAEILAAYRRLVSNHPPAMNYAQIWDCRHWAGTAFDDEIAAHLEWNREFRLAHGLGLDALPPMVLLVHKHSGANAIAAQFANFRGLTVPIVISPVEAWRAINPATRIPPDVERFLAGNRTMSKVASISGNETADDGAKVSRWIPELKTVQRIASAGMSRLFPTGKS